MITQDRINDFKKSATYKMAVARGAFKSDVEIIDYLKGIEELHKGCVYLGGV